MSLTEVSKGAPNATLDRAEIIDAFLTDIMVKVNMFDSKGAVRRYPSISTLSKGLNLG